MVVLLSSNKKLSKDKDCVSKSEKVNSAVIEDEESSEDSSEDSNEDSNDSDMDEEAGSKDESSTSPIKIASCSQASRLDDSGIGSPESKAVSSKKGCLEFDID